MLVLLITSFLALRNTPCPVGPVHILAQSIAAPKFLMWSFNKTSFPVNNLLDYYKH